MISSSCLLSDPVVASLLIAQSDYFSLSNIATTTNTISATMQITPPRRSPMFMGLKATPISVPFE
jgi:hypothetical protein